MLKAMDPAPDFTLADQEGQQVRLSDFRGKKVLIYFYPKADTPGCTTQACSIRDARPDLAGLGLTALGISPDQPAALQKFSSKYGLGFTLLSDPDHAAAEAYGVWSEKKMYGKSYLGIVRSSFLIDEEGRVVAAWYKISPKDTVPAALEALGRG
jgi:peroxiredoxin Q/BCP